jgi:hypothetical protein
MSASASARARKASPARREYRRRGVDYDMNGWIKIEHRYLMPMNRLARGQTELAILVYLIGETESKTRKTGSPASKFSRPISHEEWAWIVSCDVRMAQEAISGLLARKIIERAKEPRSKSWCYRPAVECWEELFQQEARKPPASADTLDDEEEGEEEAKDDRTILRVGEKPFVVKAGVNEKPLDLPEVCKKVEFRATADVMIDPVICRGVLRIMVSLPAGEEKAQQRSIVRSNSSQSADSTRLTESNLHSMLDDYWLRHYGKVPDKRIAGEIIAAAGTARPEQYWKICAVAIRAGRELTPRHFVLFAQDAASSAPAAARLRKEAEDAQAAQNQHTALDAIRMALRYPDDPVSQEILTSNDPALIKQVERELEEKRA